MMTAEPGGFVETSDGTLVHFIDLDLHAEALRTDVVDPILLIHGPGRNWHHWSRQLGGLAHSRRVVAVDVRGGAGKTRWLRPGWSTADMAADIHSVTTHLGLRRPAVVGCSMGGTIALSSASAPTSGRIRLVRSLRSEWDRRSPGLPTRTCGRGWWT